MITVFTNGCFDVIHVAHVRLLQFAREQGDKLIVAINSDASTQRIKGAQRPIVPANERAEILRALACVDDVLIFDEDTPELLIRRLRPDVLVKGPACRIADIPGAAFVESIGGRVVITDWPVNHSTTQLVGRMNVSFDFDGTLHRNGVPCWPAICRLRWHHEAGHRVSIVTTRTESHEQPEWWRVHEPRRVLIGEFIARHRLSVEQVVYTTHQPKFTTLVRHGIELHYDDDPIEAAATVGSKVKVVLLNGDEHNG